MLEQSKTSQVERERFLNEYHQRNMAGNLRRTKRRLARWTGSHDLSSHYEQSQEILNNLFLFLFWGEGGWVPDHNLTEIPSAQFQADLCFLQVSPFF